ncbi:MAG: hypothetical protein QOG20_6077 [Pseudonocardiales bacterium]|nr:hypothetical protein [Pseudonocardiales bacterium]
MAYAQGGSPGPAHATPDPVPTPPPPPTSAPSSSTMTGTPVTAPVVTPAGYSAQVFSRPSLSAPVILELPSGYEVTILCTAQGDPTTSQLTGVTSSLWDGTTDSSGAFAGFIPDVYVNTPTYQATMPDCSMVHT